MSNILKEFLVGLGFEIDEQGSRDFNKATEAATERVEALGEEIAKTEKAKDDSSENDKERAKRQKEAEQRAAKERAEQAKKEREDAKRKDDEEKQREKERKQRQEQRIKELMVFANVATDMAEASVDAMFRIASQFNNTQLMAIRTKSSASGIEQLNFAGGQLGINPAASLANFDQFLSASPGAEDLLNRQGVATRESNGEMRDRAKVFKDLGEVLRKMDMPQSIAFGGAVGLDYDTIQAFRRGDMQRLMDQQATIAKGLNVNLDEAASNIHLFAMRLGETLVAVKIFSMGVLGEAARFANEDLGKVIASTLALFGNKTAQGAIDADIDAQSKGQGYETRQSGQNPFQSTPAAQPANARPTRGDRNNNPGNLVYGDFARRHGATGQDSGGFAIFPDRATGTQASIALLHSYAGMGLHTISQIARRWNNGDPNGAALFIKLATKLTGKSADAFVNLNSPQVLQQLQQARERTEGTHHPSAPELTNQMLAAQNTYNNGSNVSIQQTNYNSFDGASPTLAGDVSGAALGPIEAIVRNSLPRAK